MYLFIIILLSLCLLYMFSSHKKEVLLLQQKINALESGLARVNDECETRIATIKSTKEICPEPADGLAMSDFINSMPPEFATKFSAELSRNLAPGLCEKMPDRFSKKKRQRSSSDTRLISPNDTTSESSAE
jgi:hypothetical protein